MPRAVRALHPAVEPAGPGTAVVSVVPEHRFGAAVVDVRRELRRNAAGAPEAGAAGRHEGGAGQAARRGRNHSTDRSRARSLVGRQIVGTSSYAPHTSRSTSHISPMVA